MKMKRWFSIMMALVMVLGLLPGLALPARAAEETNVPYIERGWDETNETVTTTEKTAASCTVVDSSATSWGIAGEETWYALTENVTVGSRITVIGDVHLILCDGCTLNADKGITVAKGNSLTIYGQSQGNGTLKARGSADSAGIGGTDGGYTATADEVGHCIIYSASDGQWGILEDLDSDLENGTSRNYHIFRRTQNGDGSFSFVEGYLYECELLEKQTIRYGQTDEYARAAVDAALAGTNIENEIVAKVDEGSTALDHYLQSRLKSMITVDHEISYSVRSFSYSDNGIAKYRYEIHINLDEETVKSFTSSEHTTLRDFQDSFDGSVLKTEKEGFIKTVTETMGYQTVTKQLLLIQGDDNSWTAYVRNGENGRLRDYGLNVSKSSYGTPEAKNNYNKLNSIDQIWFAYFPREAVTTLKALNRIGSGEIVKNGDDWQFNGGYFKDADNGTYRFVDTADQDGSCGDITINGGSVTATGVGGGAGIGGGRSGDGGTVTIYSGSVTATGGKNAAGIGGGGYGDGGTVTIYGGSVAAVAGEGGEAIGHGGGSSESGELTHNHSFTYSLTGDTTVTAVCNVGCCSLENNTAAVSIVPPERTLYGDTSKSAEATVTGDTDVLGNPTVNYYTANDDGTRGEALSAAPGNAGTFWAEFTLGEQTAHVVYTIDTVELTITVDAASKVYGDADPELTYTATGLLDGDAITGSLDRVAGENVGTYAIEQGTLTAGDNYAVTFNGANLTISPAKATVTADNKTKTVGDEDPELTATVIGLVGSDTLKYALSRAQGETVGEYAITVVTGENPNYDVTTVNGSLTIREKCADGHTLTKTEAKAATCTEAGNDEYWTCSGCGLYFSDGAGQNEIKEDSWVIEALNHDYQEVKDSAVKETCTEAGKETDRKCSRCGDVISGKIIEPTGHAEVVDDEVEATCTGDGLTKGSHCSACGEVLKAQETIAALGHDWNEWKVTAEPEIGRTGKRERSCRRCSETETEIIPALIGYTVIEGGDGSWTKESGTAFTIRVKRSEDDDVCISHYTETLIDGKAVVVSAKAGSTIVTLSAETLEKLSVGTHTVTVKFDDGLVEIGLTVKSAPAAPVSPKTGDNGLPGLWTALVVSSVAVGGLTVFVRRRRKTAR